LGGLLGFNGLTKGVLAGSYYFIGLSSNGSGSLNGSGYSISLISFFFSSGVILS